MNGSSGMIGSATKPAHAQNRPDARGYEAARDVNARAAVAGSGDAPHTRNAMARLDRALESGVPLNRDVPRGYYLDIEA